MLRRSETEHWPAAKLFPDERVVVGAGVPALAMFRDADVAKPLAIYLPGGGHLARIAYGHPGADPEDFLLTHLFRAGHSTLALSYPTAHPCFDHPLPGITITEWAECAAQVAATHVLGQGLPRHVIAMGWSLGGRLARDLTVALRAHAIEIDIFVGLSATPPMPGFGGLSSSDLRLATSGLLDGSSEGSPIFRSRERGLSVVDRINGRVVLPRDVYARLYVTDSPINFRGEAERFTEHGLVTDIGAAVTDQGSFDFRNYPICGSVAGGGPTDVRHALTSAAAWGMVTAQSLYFNVVEPALMRGEGALASAREPDPSRWADLRALMGSLTERLSRHVEGSHFFFVGRAGASATARHVQELADEAALVRSELAGLLA